MLHWTRNLACPQGGDQHETTRAMVPFYSGDFTVMEPHHGGVNATLQSMVDLTQTVSMRIMPGLRADFLGLWTSPSAASVICLAIGRSNCSRIAAVVVQCQLTLWRSCTRFAHG